MSGTEIPVTVEGGGVIPVSVTGGTAQDVVVSGGTVAQPSVVPPTTIPATLAPGPVAPVTKKPATNIGVVVKGAIPVSVDMPSSVTLVREDLEEDMDGYVLTNASSYYPGGDWVSGDLDTSWLVLPVGRVRYPRLREECLIQWWIPSVWYNSGGSAQIVDYEFMVDGAPTGIVFSVSTSDVCLLQSRLKFYAELQSYWEPTGGEFYELEARIALFDQTDVKKQEVSSSKLLSIDSSADRVLGWRVRKRNSVSGNGLLPRGVKCIQPVWRRGT